MAQCGGGGHENSLCWIRSSKGLSRNRFDALGQEWSSHMACRWFLGASVLAPWLYAVLVLGRVEMQNWIEDQE